MMLGVDLGGTKIEAIVLTESGQSLWRERVATPQGDYAQTLDTIKCLVARAKSECHVLPQHRVGIGSPGALFFDETKQTFVLRNANSTVLNGKPFLDDLKACLACEVSLENDANCFVLAEACSGQGQHLSEAPQSVFGVILGTGVGGGVVVAQKLLKGRHGIAGEWGHNMLPASALLALPESERGRECYCGRQDCIETYLSGPGLMMSYQRRFHQEKTSVEIVHDMRQGEAKASVVWQNYIAQLATALANVVNILDPDLIVLGGGLSLIEELYLDLPAAMRQHVFTQTFTSPILPAALGDSAGVYGAAWLNAD